MRITMRITTLPQIIPTTSGRCSASLCLELTAQVDITTSMNMVFSLLLHVLGPKYERRQRPRNSQKSSGQGGAGET